MGLFSCEMKGGIQMKQRVIAIVCTAAMLVSSICILPEEAFAAHTHKYTDTVLREATQNTEGLMMHKCSCGDIYFTVISKLTASAEPDKPEETVKTTEPTKPKPKPTEPKKLTKAQRTAKARQAAVNWAIKIANDNDFHYGQHKWAHHHGCYFCGTNQKKGSPKRKDGASVSQCKKSYCCNPFVTAIYCHGAGAKEVNCKVRTKRINLANDYNPALNNKKAFKKISKPKKVTSLVAGDVLLTPTHAMLYVGNGKIAEATGGDSGKRDKRWNNSIRVTKISSWQWKRVSKIFRYIGTGKF